jgi:dihydrofolate synthase / folylpolyglutamate synthase
MTYDEAIDYITEALKFGINPGLDKIEAVCARLGNPQLNYRTIQITGTNGKTSTTWMTRSLLSASGLKVGCYTSPHLHSYRERITIDGVPISKDAFAKAVESILPQLEKVKAESGELTEFEILTAVAVYYFNSVKVDAAVLEVGLGGRWDATSVVSPDVAVITGISLDHTDRLGDTIEQIAWDKAHIIKDGSRPVLGRMPVAALKVVEERCAMFGAKPARFEEDYSITGVEIIKNEGSKFDLRGIYKDYSHIDLAVFGEYQIANFSLAIAVCEIFLNAAINEEALKMTAQTIKCPGRFELVSTQPSIVLDGAHNPEGMQMVVDGLSKSFDFDKLYVILAISSDKDIEKMIQILANKADMVLLSQNNSYRSATPTVLADIALKLGNSYSIEPDLTNSIKHVLAFARDVDLVCITGSLYTVADAREILKPC